MPIFRVMLIGCLFSITAPYAIGTVEAAIDEQDAIKALIGEAGGQQDDELLAHAFALRNRGTLQGVYGYKAIKAVDGNLWRFKGERKVEPISPEQWQRVSKTWWKAVLNDVPDPVEGRTEWRSEYDLKIMKKAPEAYGLYDGKQIGQTWFYRLKKGDSK